MESLSVHLRLVDAESERLTQYLMPLSPAAWHHPSACPGWEVGDVVAHLTRGAEAYIAWITRGLQGDTAPPPGRTGAVEGPASAVRRAQRALEVRARLGAQLFATFQASAQQFHTLVATMPARHWDVLCYHPTGLRPVRDFVALRLGELVLHGWDIAAQLAPDFHLSAESLPVCLTLLPGMLAWAFHPGPALPAPVRCRMLGLDQVPHGYDLLSTGAQAWLVAPAPEQTPVTCQCDAETLLLLLSGRLALSAARAAGRLHLVGETQWLRVLMDWFPGEGHAEEKP